jgi:hypothetical protein
MKFQITTHHDNAKPAAARELPPGPASHLQQAAALVEDSAGAERLKARAMRLAGVVGRFPLASAAR